MDYTYAFVREVVDWGALIVDLSCENVVNQLRSQVPVVGETDVWIDAQVDSTHVKIDLGQGEFWIFRTMIITIIN